MEPKARLGVLFIHGIGQQSKGETLVNWLDPLVRWTSAWVTGAQAGKLDSAPPSCLIREASVRGDSEPPHVLVEMKAPPSAHGVDPACSRLKFAEAYWAQSFPPLSVQEITTWLLETGPMTLLLHFGLQVRRAFRQSRASRGIGIVNAGFLLVISVLKLVLSAAFLPIFLAALFLILLLRLIPLPGVTQALMRRIQVILASVIGDTTVFSASPARLAAILTEVRQTMAWLEPRCESMIIVAHSQGAAVLRHAMDPDRQLPPPGNLSGIVTLGSGQRKLDALLAVEAEKAKGGRGDSVMHSLIAIFARILTLCGGFALLAASAGFSVISSSVAIVFITLFLVNFLLYALVDPDPQNSGALWWQRIRQLHPEAEWLDLYASHDPVCNGAIWDQGQAPEGCVSCEVANRRSLIGDHTSYWENQAGFVSRVALFLARVGKLEVALHKLKPGDLDLIAKEATARGMRIGFVNALLGLTWIAGLSPLLFAEKRHLAAFGDSIRTHLAATTSNFGMKLDGTNFGARFLSMESATITQITYIGLLVLAYFAARWIGALWNACGAATLAGHNPIDVNIEILFALNLSLAFPMEAWWMLDRAHFAVGPEWFALGGVLFGGLWMSLLHRKVRFA